MEYIGRTKVGRVKTNPSTVLAIVRLPVELKEYAGKWAHIWKVDRDTILIRFSESKETEELPSVYFGVHQAMGNDIEERVRRLEVAVEELRRIIMCGNNTSSSYSKTEMRRPGFEPGAGARQAPVLPGYTTGAQINFDIRCL